MNNGVDLGHELVDQISVEHRASLEAEQGCPFCAKKVVNILAPAG
jgi:hypothetical protein